MSTLSFQRLAAAAVLAVPGLAAACASCARDQSTWGIWLVGGMIAAPYLVAVVVVRAIRAADSQRGAES